MFRITVCSLFAVALLMAASTASAQSVSAAPRGFSLGLSRLTLATQVAGDTAQSSVHVGGTHSNMGLVIGGTVMLSVGYLTSAMLGIFAGNPILLIPVLGGAIHGPVNGTGGGWALGLGLFAVQTVGLILLILGAVAEIPNEPQAVASWTPHLAAGPGDAGMGLDWFF